MNDIKFWTRTALIGLMTIGIVILLYITNIIGLDFVSTVLIMLVPVVATGRMVHIYWMINDLNVNTMLYDEFLKQEQLQQLITNLIVWLMVLVVYLGGGL